MKPLKRIESAQAIPTLVFSRKASCKDFLLSTASSKPVSARKKQPERKWKYSHFEEILELGKGSFGKVCLCKEKKTGLMVAIKIISKKKLEEHDLLDQVVQEVKLHAAC